MKKQVLHVPNICQLVNTNNHGYYLLCSQYGARHSPLCFIWSSNLLAQSHKAKRRPRQDPDQAGRTPKLAHYTAMLKLLLSKQLVGRLVVSKTVPGPGHACALVCLSVTRRSTKG